MKIQESDQSELQRFARWFHQDFGLMFNDVACGTEVYLASLSPEQKRRLLVEVGVLLESYPRKENKGLKSAWLKLGAQWWHPIELPLILKRLVGN